MSIPTPEELREMFDLRDGGTLVWRKPSKYHKNVAGEVAGGAIPNRNGKYYWTISIGGRKYKRSRLVFCIVHGRWPTVQIDHRDGNSLNDEPSNLREATQIQNAWNHKGRRKRSPLPMGVKLLKNGRFQARIAVHKRSISLGTYPSADEAAAVYVRARQQHFGEFA